MKAAFLLMLPTDTRHSHSQVVALTRSVKQHLDQMENLFSLRRSLVLFCILSSNIKRTIKVKDNQVNSIIFPFIILFALRFDVVNIQSPWELLCLHSHRHSLPTSHLVKLKISLPDVLERCLSYITPSEVSRWVPVLGLALPTLSQEPINKIKKCGISGRAVWERLQFK